MRADRVSQPELRGECEVLHKGDKVEPSFAGGGEGGTGELLYLPREVRAGLPLVPAHPLNPAPKRARAPRPRQPPLPPQRLHSLPPLYPSLALNRPPSLRAPHHSRRLGSHIITLPEGTRTQLTIYNHTNQTFFIHIFYIHLYFYILIIIGQISSHSWILITS